MKLNGTKAHTNLKVAFAGESQANRRYLYFANKADIEGNPEVASLRPTFIRSTALIIDTLPRHSNVRCGQSIVLARSCSSISLAPYWIDRWQPCPHLRFSDGGDVPSCGTHC